MRGCREITPISSLGVTGPTSELSFMLDYVRERERERERERCKYESHVHINKKNNTGFV